MCNVSNAESSLNTNCHIQIFLFIHLPSLVSDFSSLLLLLLIPSPCNSVSGAKRDALDLGGKGGDVASSMLSSLFFSFFFVFSFSYSLSLTLFSDPLSGSIREELLNNWKCQTAKKKKRHKKKKYMHIYCNNTTSESGCKKRICQMCKRKVSLIIRGKLVLMSQMSLLFFFNMFPVLSRASTLNLHCSVEACSVCVCHSGLVLNIRL